MMHIEAITATGRTRRVAPGVEFELEANLLVGRHPRVGANESGPPRPPCFTST